MSDSRSIELLGRAHRQLVHKRRVAALDQRLAAMLSEVSTLLDLGCGDGAIAQIVGQSVPGLTVSGAGYILRPDSAIPRVGFDGLHLPFPDQSFDGCIFVYVLHHS